MAYRWHNGEWKPGELIIPDNISGESRFPLSTPGEYGFFLDEISPFLGGIEQTITVGPNEKQVLYGIKMPKWQPFALSLGDLGAGVAPETIKTYLNDNLFVVEPDLPRDQILVVLPDETTVGFHVMNIEIADEVGNLLTQEIKIEVVQ